MNYKIGDYCMFVSDEEWEIIEDFLIKELSEYEEETRMANEYELEQLKKAA